MTKPLSNKNHPKECHLKDNISVDVRRIVILFNPTPEHPLLVEYLPDSREVVLRTPRLEPLTEQTSDGNTVSLRFQEFEMRFSEDSIRQLFEKLPPELLH